MIKIVNEVTGDEVPRLLTPAEMARAMRLHTVTLARWARAGRIRSTRTLGGHRRYYREDAEAYIRGELIFENDDRAEKETG